MARYFLDSSALAKRYHRERGAPAVESLFAPPANRLLISNLTVVEIHSCFARLFREGLFTHAEFSRLIARLEDDVAAGTPTIVAMGRRQLNEASTLLDTRGLSLPLRTLDAIQLATAMAVHSRQRLDGFVSADKRLLAVAAACGLQTLDVN